MLSYFFLGHILAALIWYKFVWAADEGAHEKVVKKRAPHRLNTKSMQLYLSS